MIHAYLAKDGTLFSGIVNPVHMVAIWNTMVDRLADIIERIGTDLDTLSREIFSHSRMRSSRRQNRKGPRALEDILSDVGHGQDVVFRIRESLQSLDRVFAF